MILLMNKYRLYFKNYPWKDEIFEAIFFLDMELFPHIHKGSLFWSRINFQQKQKKKLIFKLIFLRSTSET